ncbi:MAG: hypothetical protein Q4B84_03860 [Clostridia bacterium]|nr:hypothetical protein [Clostridia bacterium]
MAKYKELRETFKKIQNKRKKLKDLIGDEFNLLGNGKSFYNNISKEFKDLKKILKDIQKKHDWLSKDLSDPNNKIEIYSGKASKILSSQDNKNLLDLGSHLEIIRQEIEKIRLSKIKLFYGENTKQNSSYSIIKSHCKSSKLDNDNLPNDKILELAEKYLGWIENRIAIVKNSPTERSRKTPDEILGDIQLANKQLLNINNLLDDISSSNNIALIKISLKKALTYAATIASLVSGLYAWWYSGS